MNTELLRLTLQKILLAAVQSNFAVIRWRFCSFCTVLYVRYPTSLTSRTAQKIKQFFFLFAKLFRISDDGVSCEFTKNNRIYYRIAPEAVCAVNVAGNFTCGV